MRVNTACSFLGPSQIQIIEEKYNAKYVLESSLKDKDDRWINMSFAIFYTERAHPEGSNYFGIYLRDGHSYITNGITATEGSLVGVCDMREEVVEYSRYRNDYRDCGQFFVDGGREYLRWGALNPDACKVVKFHIVNGNIVFD
jgi:hypothetical protein